MGKIEISSTFENVLDASPSCPSMLGRTRRLQRYGSQGLGSTASGKGEILLSKMLHQFAYRPGTFEDWPKHHSKAHDTAKVNATERYPTIPNSRTRLKPDALQYDNKLLPLNKHLKCRKVPNKGGWLVYILSSELLSRLI